MKKYYTRACNFYYGNNANLLIKKKLALPLCGNKNIIRVFDLGNTPLANSYSNKNVSIKLKKYPLGLNLCNSCGHLQLSHSIKPQKMFSNYLYKTNTSHKNLNYCKLHHRLKNLCIAKVSTQKQTFEFSAVTPQAKLTQNSVILINIC